MTIMWLIECECIYDMWFVECECIYNSLNMINFFYSFIYHIHYKTMWMYLWQCERIYDIVNIFP